MRMRHTLSPVAYLTLQYISTFLIHGTIFRKKITEHKMSVLIFSTTYLWDISILRKTEGDTVINVHTSASKAPVTLVRF